MSDQQLETRRDRRIKRQKQQIMDAAAALFAEKGYNATTTRDIALTVDIGESTLYGYFPGKREILIAILTQQVDSMDSFIARIDQFTNRDEFITVSDNILELILTNSIYTRALIGEAWINDEILNNFVTARLQRVGSLLMQFIEEKTSSGLLRPIDPGIGARIIISAFIGAILPVLRGVAPVPSAEERLTLAETIVSIIMDGMIQKKE
jgi:AcrR family transcriptional regulator